MTESSNYCYYSDLPSPMAYMEEVEETQTDQLSVQAIDRIIEMAWEDRTKHIKKRVAGIDRFKCNLQRHISSNKLSKRK